MLRLPLVNRIVGKIATLLFVAAFTAVPSHADGPQDLEIMVNGPWTFVVYADPTMYGGDDRLYLVAPADETHFASIWSGPDASMRNWMKLMMQGKPPQLICPSGSADNTTCPNGVSKQYLYSVAVNSTPVVIGAPAEERESVYSASTRVSHKNVAAAILTPGTSRYAISLPMPDYVKTYSGDYGPGVAEAKLERSTDPSLATGDAEYSTWTVLHYGLQSLDRVTVTTKNSGDQNPFDVTIVALLDRDKTITRYGISLSLMQAPLCNTSTPDMLKYYPKDCTKYSEFSKATSDDEDCDTLSGFSFAASTVLWQLPDYALFPSEQDSEGTQNPLNYRYFDTGTKLGCPAAYKGNAAQLKTNVVKLAREHVKALADITSLEDQLDLATSAKTKKMLEQAAKAARADGQSPNATLGVQAFSQVLADTDAIYPAGIPDEAAIGLYCACTLAGNSDSDCKKEFDLAATPSCGQKNRFDLDFDLVAAQDKGSSDCHSPQISINGAIQP